MKLPDFTIDAALNELRRMMDAELRIFIPASNSDVLTLEDLEILATKGKDVPLNEVRVLPDGTLAYRNQRVVVYIRDVKQYRNSAPGEQDLPRFHVSHCDKLQEMRDNNRYQRYVVATRDSGVFQINLKAQDAKEYSSREERLRVCQFCLAKLNWEDFTSHRQERKRRNDIVQSFTLVDYFARYGKTFVEVIPNHTAATAPVNEYTSDFKEVAERIKRKRKFRCDQCSVDLSERRKFLHAHHINGQQSENHEDNISILCIRCHADEYNHQHMKKLPEYKEFMKLLQSGKIGE